MLDSQVGTRPAISSAARTIGVGALVLAVAYVVLSVGRPLLILAFGQADDGAFLKPQVAGSAGSQVVGVFFAIVFFTMAGSMLVMRAGLRAAASSTNAWTALITDAAILGASGFALVGGLGRVTLSRFASSLSDTGADVASQVAALHVANIVTGAGAIVGGVGLCRPSRGIRDDRARRGRLRSAHCGRRVDRGRRTSGRVRRVRVPASAVPRTGRVLGGCRRRVASGPSRS